LIGTVINVAETHLKGVYLVNYQRDGEVRAAVATLDHAAWALTDAAGRQWWIVKVCGNLASPLPGQVVVVAPTPQTVPLTALAGADALAVRECPAENCRVLANIPKGQTLELKGCLSDRSWCQVVLADGRVGWCQGGTLRFVAALAAVPVVKAPEARLASSGKIAFFSDRDSPGYAEIYLMNPNGSELTRLTSDLRIPPVMRGGPPSINRFVWSQARRKFLFQNPSGAKLYSVNGDGTGSAIIATGVGYSDPSPDGQLIAYTAYKDQRSEIGLMDFNGSNQRLLTNQATRQYLNLKADSALNGPAWSSDGKRLAFYTAENAICTITLANSTEARLTSAAVSIAGGQLRWSPDDRFITFAAIVGRNYNLFKLEVASGKIMQLVEDGWSSGWSPDGTGIVLERSDEQIWIVNANGSGLTQLTYQGRNCCPVWVP
jgi:TolB protein